jgi:hypothetical protein
LRFRRGGFRLRKRKTRGRARCEREQQRRKTPSTAPNLLYPCIHQTQDSLQAVNHYKHRWRDAIKTLEGTIVNLASATDASRAKQKSGTPQRAAQVRIISNPAIPSRYFFV